MVCKSQHVFKLDFAIGFNLILMLCACWVVNKRKLSFNIEYLPSKCTVNIANRCTIVWVNKYQNIKIYKSVFIFQTIVPVIKW